MWGGRKYDNLMKEITIDIHNLGCKILVQNLHETMKIVRNFAKSDVPFVNGVSELEHYLTGENKLGYGTIAFSSLFGNFILNILQIFVSVNLF